MGATAPTPPLFGQGFVGAGALTLPAPAVVHAVGEALSAPSQPASSAPGQLAGSASGQPSNAAGQSSSAATGNDGAMGQPSDAAGSADAAGQLSNGAGSADAAGQLSNAAGSVDAAVQPSRAGTADPASGDLPEAPEVANSATFTFHATVETSRPRLYLGEVASCFGPAAVCDEAYGVDLGPSPEPGRSTLLHPDQLQAVVAKEWPDVDVRVEGPKLVKVTALAATLDEGSVLSALKSLLAERLPADARFAAEVEKLAVTMPPRLRPAEFHVEFPELTADRFANPDWVLRNLSGNVRLAAACVMETEGARVVPFTVTAQIALKERLPVPSRDLAKGDVVQAKDLTEAFIDVNRGALRPVADEDELTGRRLRRDAPAYAPIMPGQTEIPKVVHRGQLVRLVMNAGGLQVTGQVVAKDEGGYGQQIDAVYPATKKRLRVRILDASTVEYVQ